MVHAAAAATHLRQQGPEGRNVLQLVATNEQLALRSCTVNGKTGSKASSA
jgi:hypothetical protein